MRLYQGEIVSLVFSCILCNAFQKNYSLPHLLATLSHLVKCGSIRIQLLLAVCSSIKYENVLIRQAYICSKKHSKQRTRSMSLQCFISNVTFLTIKAWFCFDFAFLMKVFRPKSLWCYISVMLASMKQHCFNVASPSNK